MFTIITASTTELLASAQSLLTGVWPAVLVAVAIPLGFYVGKKVIGLFPKR